MKRLVSIVLFSLSFWGLQAQEGIPLLDKVAGHRVHFHYTYSLSRAGADFAPVTDGQVTVEGNAYILEGLGMKVLSDGTTRWTLDPEAKEAVVEAVQKEDLFTNPALFIGSYRDYMDKLQVNAAGSDNLDITLTLDEQTRARFVLSGIVYGEEQGKSDFSLEEKSLSGYLVTDLR